MSFFDTDSVPTSVLERGDVVRIQCSWTPSAGTTVAAVVAVLDEGPIVDGPEIDEPMPARAGTVLEVLEADTLLGFDGTATVHTLDRDRAVVELYRDGERVREIDVPNAQIRAYLQNVEYERGWTKLLPSFADLLNGGEDR